MQESISQKLESALLKVNKFGIRLKSEEIEELVRIEYLNTDENDGWNVSSKRRQYKNLYKFNSLAVS